MPVPTRRGDRDGKSRRNQALIRKTSLLRDRPDVTCGQARDDKHRGTRFFTRPCGHAKDLAPKCWRLRSARDFHLARSSERSPLHAVRKPARRIRDAREQILPDEPSRWWSQTGSNRRPPACKAGALPAELWPRSAGMLKSLAFKSAVVAKAGLPSRSSHAAFARLRLACASEGWWAWEDLNFRPHAYQARALTN
jgi:hypothetical protein